MIIFASNSTFIEIQLTKSDLSALLRNEEIWEQPEYGTPHVVVKIIVKDEENSA